MSNATRKVARANKKKEAKGYKVSGEIQEDLQWDELVALYNVCKDALANSGQIITKIGADFKSTIDTDHNIHEAYVGVSNMVTELVNEVLKVAALHTGEGNKPYTGPVDNTKVDQLDLYMNVVIGYNGIIERISASMENATTSLMTMIEVHENEKGDKGGE